MGPMQVESKALCPNLRHNHPGKFPARARTRRNPRSTWYLFSTASSQTEESRGRSNRAAGRPGKCSKLRPGAALGRAPAISGSTFNDGRLWLFAFPPFSLELLRRRFSPQAAGQIWVSAESARVSLEVGFHLLQFGFHVVVHRAFSPRDNLALEPASARE